MRAIFISYRRNDAEGQAGRLFKDLTERFGADSVFMDVVDIEPGRDFRRVIDQQVASCGVLLAIIGKDWLDARDESGRRRLDDPSDFVRLETATALKRDIPVIPVLVQGARMPKADQLPPDLAELAFRNGVELTHARWDSDVEVLVKALRPHMEGGATEADRTPPAGEKPPSAPEPPAKSWRIAAAGAVLAAVAAGGYWAYDQSRKEAERAEAQQAAARAAAEKTAEAERAAARAEIEKARAEASAAKAAAENAALRAEAARAEAATEKAVVERAAGEKAAAERAAAARTAAAERAAAEKAEADRLAREKAAEAERRAREKAAEAERAARAGAPDQPASPQATKTAKYEATISTNDPCTGRTVTVRGQTSVGIKTTSTGVAVYMGFTGSGDGYTAGYRGKDTLPQQAKSYDIPIAGEWKREGRPAFSSEGIDRVLADRAGNPTGDRILNLDNRCLR